MRKISIHIVPPGGWKYQEGSTWIIGDSFEDLVSVVGRHRSNNGMDPGKPAEDIENQLISLYPSLKMDVIKIISNGY